MSERILLRFILIVVAFCRALSIPRHTAALEEALTKRRLHQALCFTLLLVVFGSMGCKDDPAGPSSPQTETGAWARYTPYKWTHDGRPYHSSYFTIYSDAASDQMKRQLGEIADARFVQILSLFDFDDVADFVYPPGLSKLEIYINRHHAENINWAYWGGFIITIRAAEISGRWHDYTVYTVRHEATHEFEFLIEGREALATDVWFKEGIAVHVGCLEDTGWRTIEDLDELESWISQNRNVPGLGNPIRIHRDADYPDQADRPEYYRLFELAVRYVLDENGMGRSFRDVLGLFYDLREGRSFADAFERRFGASVSAFEADFFDRMRVYLTKQASLIGASRNFHLDPASPGSAGPDGRRPKRVPNSR